MDDQNRNLILALALSLAVLLGWTFLFPHPKPEPASQTTTAQQAAPADGSAAPGIAATPPGSATAPATATKTAGALPEQAPRLDISTPELNGSISLTGGRIDQLSLTQYKDSLDPDSPNVDLLSPVGSAHPYYALYGWAPGEGLDYSKVPGADTPWTVESGDKLSPGHPVTLKWDNGAGLVFHRTLSVDDKFMFTVTQSVDNNTGAAVRLAPYGIVARHGQPEGRQYWVLHEGVVRMSDNALEEIKYKKMPALDVVQREGSPAELIDVKSNGWIGFTDKYWMTTLIPDPGQAFTSVVKYVANGDIYQTEARLPTMSVEPGKSAQVSTMLFAGAKEWQTLKDYQQNDHIDRFVDSIDWGWFFFLTKPIFWLLHHLHALIGNMGWSIILMTLFLKALLFPLAYKSYMSMAKMKELQPEMEKIKERVGDDRMKMQAEVMALYKREKVNPAAGCLPLLLQIPIFFSLYKVIFVTLELRHAGWIGWIHDLSAPDPSSILNLFGLLPFAAPGIDSPFHIVSIGILPIFLGISMWLQQKLNPAPADPSQKMIFAWMPWVFMFMLGTFPSGLVLYWITNNTLTFIQQYTIMRVQGYKPDIFGNIRSSFKGKKKKAAK